MEALLASRSLAGSLRRTAVLVGALSTAIAMMAAVGIMVGSFRQTVLLWMEDRLQADLYLRPAGPAGADRHPTLARRHRRAARGRCRDVAAVDRFRAYEISYQGLPATLGGGDARIVGAMADGRSFPGADPPSVFAQLTRQRQRHRQRAVREQAPRQRGRHARRCRSAADAPGSTSSTSTATIPTSAATSSWTAGTLLKYLPDPAPSNVAVYLRPGVDRWRTDAAQSNRALAGRKRADVHQSRRCARRPFAIFDRTFAITYALEAVAVFVAVMGIAGALLALVIDRRREFGLLRFLGGATGQIRRIILFEAGLARPARQYRRTRCSGIVLSLLLIYVINRQSFGWTIQFHWPVAVLLAALSLVYLATVLAALYPARVATRLNPIEVIHEE